MYASFDRILLSTDTIVLTIHWIPQDLSLDTTSLDRSDIASVFDTQGPAGREINETLGHSNIIKLILHLLLRCCIGYKS
jgi:hypothetical protein